MDDFTITVSIADRSYRIKIQRDKEELIRYAAKSVNTSVQKYAENYAYSDKQDLLALTALEFASGLKGKESEFAEQEAGIAVRLKKLEDEITGKLGQ